MKNNALLLNIGPIGPMFHQKKRMAGRCLVLDLDETLVHTENGRESLDNIGIFTNPHLMDIQRRTYFSELEDAIGPKGKGDIMPIWGVTRPHLQEFLDFAFSYFDVVGVWSAGRKRYVDVVVDRIFRDSDEPHFVYTWEDCEKSGNLMGKPLSRIFRDFPQCHENNTIILDDNNMVFRMNPGNGILIPPYSPDPRVESLRREDTALLNFRDWIWKSDPQADVRTLEKRVFS